MQENHLKNQFEMAPTVAVVLILSLLLTYFLMSGTMNSINDVSEQEALALLTENAVQMKNIIENQLLYLMMTEDEIVDFYRRLREVLVRKPFKIIYLDVENIWESVEIIRKERSDEKGNELWFPLMTKYLEDSPYGKKNGLRGMDGLISHLERRKALEHRIIKEVFRENAVVVKSKKYDLNEIIR